MRQPGTQHTPNEVKRQIPNVLITTLMSLAILWVSLQPCNLVTNYTFSWATTFPNSHSLTPAGWTMDKTFPSIFCIIDYVYEWVSYSSCACDVIKLTLGNIELWQFHFHRSCDCSIRMTKIKWRNNKHKNVDDGRSIRFRVDASNRPDYIQVHLYPSHNFSSDPKCTQAIEIKSMRELKFFTTKKSWTFDSRQTWNFKVFLGMKSIGFSQCAKTHLIHWRCLLFFSPPAYLMWTRHNDCKLDK